MDKDLIRQYLRPLVPIPTEFNPRGGLRKPVRSLVCDLYGTLFVSASGDINATGKANQRLPLIERLLAKYGLKITAPELLDQLRHHILETHDRLRAEGVDHPEVLIDDIWAHLLPGMNLQARRLFAVEFEMSNNPVWPMPGVKQLLAACRKKRIRLGIVSNAQFYTPYLFPWLLGSDAASLGFDPHLTLYSYQCGRAKPSADLFETVRWRLSEMGLESQTVAYIGNDMRNDIVPARAAGFQTILFAGDKRSLRMRSQDPASRSIQPDMVVTQLDQLASYLQQ